MYHRFFIACMVLMAGPAQAACSLAITRAAVTDEHGAALPLVGERCFLRVQFRVQGQPLQPYRITFTIADQHGEFRDLRGGAGNYSYVWATDCALDGPLPWTVSVDPDARTGDASPADNRAGGVFEPRYPEQAIAFYDARTYDGVQSFHLGFEPGGRIESLRAWFPVPTSGGFQEVVGYEPPERTTAIVARPYDRPVHEWLGAAASLRLTARYRLRVQNQRVNPGLLRHVTWDDLRALPPELKPYLTPQAELAPHADEISAFVARSLPADYRTRMSPYATARQLFLAVVRQLKHKDPTAQPKGVLNSDRDDCGHYAGVYVACLQAAGLPARMVPGCWTSATDSAWHVWTEVWFPGHGWMMADPSEGAACDPSGTYAYRFGIVPNGNQRCALGRGAEATTDEASTSFLQVVNFWYTGAAGVRTATTEIRHTLVDQTKGR